MYGENLKNVFGEVCGDGDVMISVKESEIVLGSSLVIVDVDFDVD